MASPLDVTGCSCWLQAGTQMYSDAGTTPVTHAQGLYQWNDISGNGRHWSQTGVLNRMKWNATDGLVESEYTPGSQQFMTNTGMPFDWQAGSVFFVTTQGTLRRGYTGSLFSQHYLLSYASTPGNIVEYSGNASYATPGRLICTDPSSKKIGTTRIPTGLSLLGYVGGASAAQAIINTTVDTLTVSSTSTQVGGLNLGVVLNGGFRDVFFYNRAVTSGADLAAIFAYAQSRGVVIDQPANLTIDGDSITDGAFATLNRNWVRRAFFGSNAEVSQYALGENSYGVSVALSERPTVVDPYLIPGKRNILTVFLGTNDIANSATGAAVYALLVSYCQGAYAAGWDKICVVTMLPRAGTDTQRAIYNQLIRDNGRTDWDAVADVGADPLMGQDGDHADTTYYDPDQIHPNDAGHAIIASYVQPAVLGLLTDSSARFASVFSGFARAEL